MQTNSVSKSVCLFHTLLCPINFNYAATWRFKLDFNNSWQTASRRLSRIFQFEFIFIVRLTNKSRAHHL